MTISENEFQKEMEDIRKVKKEMFEQSFGRETDIGGPLAAAAYAQLVRTEIKLKKRFERQAKPS